MRAAPSPSELFEPRLRPAMNAFRLLQLAMRLYTRPPQERLLAPTADSDAGRAVRFLPVVGLFVGALLGVSYVMLAQIVPHSVAVLASLAVAALITGSSHEIGLMRFCEAAVRSDGERTHPVAARAGGAVGSVALVFSVLMKLETLSSLDPSWISVAAMTGHPLSRGLAAICLRGLDGRIAGGPAITRMSGLIALAIGILPAALAIGWFDDGFAFVAGMLPATLAALLVRHLARRRAAADSQSVLGAGQQLSELAWYLGLLAWWTLGAAPPPESPDE